MTGPGLLESVYHRCVMHELSLRGVAFEAQVPVSLSYQGLDLSCRYRADLVVADALLVELKSVDVLLPVHRAQTLTYLKLLGLHEGLLINFNVPC